MRRSAAFPRIRRRPGAFTGPIGGLVPGPCSIAHCLSHLRFASQPHAHPLFLLDLLHLPMLTAGARADCFRTTHFASNKLHSTVSYTPLPLPLFFVTCVCTQRSSRRRPARTGAPSLVPVARSASIPFSQLDTALPPPRFPLPWSPLSHTSSTLAYPGSLPFTTY